MKDIANDSDSDSDSDTSSSDKKRKAESAKVTPVKKQNKKNHPKKKNQNLENLIQILIQKNPMKKRNLLNLKLKKKKFLKKKREKLNKKRKLLLKKQKLKVKPQRYLLEDFHIILPKKLLGITSKIAVK